MKKLVVGFCVAIAAVAAQAEYLYWTVSQSDDLAKSGIADKLDTMKGQGASGGGIDSYKDVYASIVVIDTDTREIVEGTGYTMGFTSEWQVGGGQQMSITMEDLLGSKVGSAENYSYYIEICSSNPSTSPVNQVIGKNTKAMTYQDMVQQGSITSSMTPVPAAAVWHGGASGGYAPVPEPTSAMLMLLGVAGLALKRKQKKA